MVETAILVALIVGITEVVKRIGLEARWLPLVAIVLGIFGNFGGKVIGAANLELVIGGLIAGLTACGLWDLGKKTVLNK